MTKFGEKYAKTISTELNIDTTKEKSLPDKNDK